MDLNIDQEWPAKVLLLTMGSSMQPRCRLVLADEMSRCVVERVVCGGGNVSQVAATSSSSVTPLSTGSDFLCRVSGPSHQPAQCPPVIHTLATDQ